MGADGHVDIYDYNKIKETLNLEDNWYPQGYGCYKQNIFGHDLVVVYYDYEWHDKYCPICGDDHETCEHWGTIKPAFLDSWEVWT